MQSACGTTLQRDILLPMCDTSGKAVMLCLQTAPLSLQSAYRYLRLPSGLHSHQPFAQLVQQATSRVRAEFDDLDAVWMNDSLQAAFLKLPLPALLVRDSPRDTMSSGRLASAAKCVCIILELLIKACLVRANVDSSVAAQSECTVGTVLFMLTSMLMEPSTTFDQYPHSC